MSKSRIILSWFLVGVYAMVLTHSFSAHVHAEGGTTSHIFNHESHSHSHSPHHGDGHGHDGSFSLIHFMVGLFNSLTHIDIGADHFEEYASVRSIVQPVNDTGFQHHCIDLLQSFLTSLLAFHANEEVWLYEQYRPDIALRLLIDTDPLRGPPSLIS